MRKIIRVFPRRTNATPVDDMVRIAEPPGFFDEADEVHVSVAFTWDIPAAEELAHQWEQVAPVKVGGPAYGKPSGEFNPGMYLKSGLTITSRGCPNHCWFCSVWRREPRLMELPIHPGYNLCDDNILACSDDHIRAVFAMLRRQKEKPRFTGGLEAKLLRFWQAKEIVDMKPKRIFFAYDTPDDLPPLRTAAKMMYDAGLSRKSHALQCYVLIGHKGDTQEKAEKRLLEAFSMGYLPFAMLYRDEAGKKDPEWASFQRKWARPEIIFSANHSGLDTAPFGCGGR